MQLHHLNTLPYELVADSVGHQGQVLQPEGDAKTADGAIEM
jgi:hypothetical protein